MHQKIAININRSSNEQKGQQVTSRLDCTLARKMGPVRPLEMVEVASAVVAIFDNCWSYYCCNTSEWSCQ